MSPSFSLAVSHEHENGCHMKPVLHVSVGMLPCDALQCRWLGARRSMALCSVLFRSLRLLSAPARHARCSVHGLLRPRSM